MILPEYLKSSIKPPGGLLNFRPYKCKRWGLIREGGLIGGGGGLIPNHIFSTKFTIIFQTLLLHQ